MREFTPDERITSADSDKPLIARRIKSGLGYSLGPRAKEASLVLCIVLLACTIAVASEHLVPPAFGVKIEPVVAHGSGSGSSLGSKSNVGTLLVEATTDSGFSIPVNTFPAPYLSGIGVTVVPTGPAPLFPTSYVTNSTGGLELSLPPSNYSVSFFASVGLPMNSSVVASVYPGETTFLQFVVSASTYEPVYVGMPANQTNVVPAWASGTLEFAAPVPQGGISSAFLDLYYYNSNSTVFIPGGALSFETPVQVPLLVTSWSVNPQASDPAEWMGFQPEVQIPLDGLMSVSVSMYYVQINVTTTAQPIPIGGISFGD